jgi:hypothetical protein
VKEFRKRAPKIKIIASQGEIEVLSRREGRNKTKEAPTTKIISGKIAITLSFN